MQPLRDKARNVRVAIFDVDGVLTDGRIYLSGSGEAFKAFHTLDGQGMKMLRAEGVALAIISGRSARAVESRARALGVDHLYQGAEDKLGAFHDLLAKTRLEPAQAACLGDDLPDLPVMRRCGLSATVAGAPALLRQHADYVTRLAGGRGAAREFCEWLLDARGALERQWAGYLR